MKLKKILAGALALSMLMTPCVSMASSEVGDIDSAKGTITGNGELEGYVPEEAFRMVLPTTATTKVGFTMDPQGLLSKTDKTNTYTSDTTGWILFGDEKTTNSSKSIITKNKSSYPVQLDVEVAIGNMKTDNVRVKFVEKEADVAKKLEDGTDDTALNMYLAAVPKKVKETDAGDAASSSKTFPVDASGTTNLSFVLDGCANNYKIGGDKATGYKYELKPNPTDPANPTEDELNESNWDQVGFTLTGNVNKNADWSEFLAAQKATGDDAEKMSIEVSYTVSKYDGIYTDIPDDSWVDKDDAHGVIISSKNVLKSDGTTDIIIECETAPTTLTITPIQCDGTLTTAFSLTKGTQWDVKDNILTIKGAGVAAVISNAKRGAGTYKVTVDGKDYVMTFGTPKNS